MATYRLTKEEDGKIEGIELNKYQFDAARLGALWVSKAWNIWFRHIHQMQLDLIYEHNAMSLEGIMPGDPGRLEGIDPELLSLFAGQARKEEEG